MNENKEKITMKGNEKDCICAKQDGKHTRRCDAYRLSEFEKKMVAVLVPTPFNYNELSHIHCWEQQNPPCGKKEHARCCLCEKYNPCNWCTDGTKCDGDCNCKCHQPTQEKKRSCPFCLNVLPPYEIHTHQEKEPQSSWEEEYVELYGYLDKYVEGIVGRQGKWIANLLSSKTKQMVEEFRNLGGLTELGDPDNVILIEKQVVEIIKQIMER